MPGRTGAVLARERGVFPAMVARLRGGATRSPGTEDDPLTMDDLDAALVGRDATVLPAAAFVAGRCRPEQSGDDRRLGELVESILGSVDPQRLASMAPAYVESAMALALRGSPERGHDLLTPLVAPARRRSSRDWLAAYYLAQMGDPCGYPAVLASLASDNEYRRLMAARHLIAFVPYANQGVDGTIVDARAALMACVDDPDPHVSREAPGLLAEMDAPPEATAPPP